MSYTSNYAKFNIQCKNNDVNILSHTSQGSSFFQTRMMRCLACNFMLMYLKKPSCGSSTDLVTCSSKCIQSGVDKM